MIIPSAVQNWLDIVYYGRIQICFLAMSLASASGIILTGQFEWRSILIVGIATHVVYNLDNILDWHAENHLLRLTRSWWTGYFIWCAVTIPIALVGAVFLVLQSTRELLLVLITLGFIGTGHILLTRYSNGQSEILLWAEHLTVSLIWAMATVLIPIYFVGRPVFPQFIRAIVYIWQISWIGVMVRNLSSSALADDQRKTKLLAEVLGEQRLIKLLQIVCASTLLLVVFDTLYGYFPWYNITLTIGPIGILVLISKWKYLRNRPRLFETLFYSGGTLGAILVTAVYYVGGIVYYLS